jgi:hypothetical protein
MGIPVTVQERTQFRVPSETDRLITSPAGPVGQDI